MARPPPTVISDVDFDKDSDDIGFELSIVNLSSDLGFNITYVVFTDSFEAYERNGVITLQAKFYPHAHRKPLELEIEMLERGSEISIRVKFFSKIASAFYGHITEDAKRKLIDFFNGRVPVDASTLPKVKVPKGQADHIFWAPIEDGTVMADFKNERDGFHRYYTKAGMDRMNPLVNMGTNLPLQQSDITYYIAQLDDSMQPTFTGNADGGRRGRRRKTLRERRRTPRNNRRST